jgi:hypothetical protein
VRSGRSLRDVVGSTLTATSRAGSASRTLGVALTAQPGSALWCAATLAILALVTALAVAVTDVGFVVSVSGASFGALLIFCVPALCFLAAKRADSGGGYPGALNSSKAEVAGVHALVAFGVLAAVFGTTVTCLETFTNLLK